MFGLPKSKSRARSEADHRSDAEKIVANAFALGELLGIPSRHIAVAALALTPLRSRGWKSDWKSVTGCLPSRSPLLAVASD